MKLRCLAPKAALIIGLGSFFLAVSASAGPIFFDTLSSGFVGGSACVPPALGSTCFNSTSGAGATIGFIADPPAAALGNVNYGNFTLVCPTCTTTAGGIGAFFPALTFNLVVHDITDNTFGTFVGTAAPGSVFLDASTMTFNWVPLQLGPGTTGASGGSGSFGTTSFNIILQTRIVNPTSGAQIGSSTVQGSIDDGVVPEPATLGLVGSALLVLGIFRRRILPQAS